MYAHLPPLPYIPGADAAGTVVALGADVTESAIGDRVYIGGSVGGKMTGGCAEHFVRPVDEVFRLPAVASYDQGAAAPPNISLH